VLLLDLTDLSVQPAGKRVGKEGADVLVVVVGLLLTREQRHDVQLAQR
jgi:hypothetical protein